VSPQQPPVWVPEERNSKSLLPPRAKELTAGKQRHKLPIWFITLVNTSSYRSYGSWKSNLRNIGRPRRLVTVQLLEQLVFGLLYVTVFFHLLPMGQNSKSAHNTPTHHFKIRKLFAHICDLRRTLFLPFPGYFYHPPVAGHVPEGSAWPARQTSGPYSPNCVGPARQTTGQSAPAPPTRCTRLISSK
jgi:hypothetical protein